MAPIHLGEIDRYFGQLYEYMTTISDQYRIAGFSLNVQLLFIMLAGNKVLNFSVTKFLNNKVFHKIIYFGLCFTADLQLLHYLLEPLR